MIKKKNKKVVPKKPDIDLYDDGVCVDPSEEASTPVEEPVVTTYIFMNKFNIPIYAMVINCDRTMMEQHILEYKVALDLKDISMVSIKGFEKWLVDKGYTVEPSEYISWL